MNRAYIAIGIALLGLIVSSISNAQSKTRGFDNPHRIPNSYIVMLKSDGPEWQRHPGRDASRNLKESVLAHNKERVLQLTNDLTREFGGRVTARYGAVLKGFAVEMDEEAAKRLAEDPRVALVEPDEPTSITTVQTNAPYHLDRIDEENRPVDGDYVYYQTGPNVFLEVLDTGVRENHSQFDDRTGGGPNWTAAGNDDGYWEDDDCNGHGTHVAGIAAGDTYGVAKGLGLPRSDGRML